MSVHDITKALEIWTLQNLLDISIMLGILASGVVLVQAYYESLEKRLTLRVSVELWRMLTILAADVLLALVVLIGYLVLNPDIMADIKMAVPFCPIATVLFAAALVLRLFYGGHEVASKNYLRALYLMLLANIIHIIGFTLVMEAPSGEYLATHPSPFWDTIKTNLRSNTDPQGLVLSQATFYFCFPLLIAVFVWGAASALRRIKQRNGE